MRRRKSLTLHNLKISVGRQRGTGKLALIITDREPGPTVAPAAPPQPGEPSVPNQEDQTK